MSNLPDAHRDDRLSGTFGGASPRGSERSAGGICADEKMNPVTLFRPVGEAELSLIRQSGWREFPPRLPEQPIFYPVLDEQYAVQIARDWNARDGGNGYVLRFLVGGDYLSRYQVQTVGSRVHREYWIPAEELAHFNEHIIPPIELIAVFSGER